MSVTFLDPQYPSRLPSRNEVLDFTITTDPADAVVTMEHESGVWETIYQGGRFALKYRASTLDGSTFHVRRSGGWPEGRWYVPVTEAPPLLTTQWEVLHDFDFTTFPTQAVELGSVVYTLSLGGYTWNVKSSVGGSPGQQQVLGSGFSLLSNSRPWASGSTQMGSAISLPLSSLPGYNSAKRQAILGVVDTSQILGAGEQFAVGHWDWLGLPSAAQTITAASQRAGGLRFRATNSFEVCHYAPSVPNLLPADGTFATVTDTDAHVFGAVRSTGDSGYSIFGPYSGTLPAIEDCKPIMGSQSSHVSVGLSGGVGWGATSGARVCVVKRICFFQEV